MTPLEYLLNMSNGSCLTAGRMLGFERQRIERWRSQGYIPHKHGTLVMRRTKGKITANSVWLAAAKARGE